MSMLFREVKCESSSSRQRDVIKLMFTCDTVMSLSPLGEPDDVDWCVDDAADPTEPARRPKPEGKEIVLVRQWRRSSG